MSGLGLTGPILEVYATVPTVSYHCLKNGSRVKKPTNQALPRILIQEPQHHVKSGSPPAFQAVGISVSVAGMPCNRLQVPTSHAGRQEGLLPVPPGAVGNQRAGMSSYLPGKFTRAMLKQHIAPAEGTGLVGVDPLARLGEKQVGDINIPG